MRKDSNKDTYFLKPMLHESVAALGSDKASDAEEERILSWWLRCCAVAELD